MRVALITEPGTGGVGRHVIDLAVGLAQRDVDVHVYCGRERIGSELPSRFEANGVRFTPLDDLKRSLGAHDARAWKTLGARLRRDGPFDIIHSHSSKAGALARVLPVPGVRVHTPHAYAFVDPAASGKARAIYRGLESGLALFTHHTVAVSADEARQAKSLPFMARKVRVIRNGLPSLPFGDRAAMRAKLELPEDAFVVGFVGRLSEQKRPLRFVEALAIAHALEPRTRGVLIGTGEQHDAVRELIEARGLTNVVRAFESDVAWSFMPAFDVFALTSAYEGLPYVLLEAQQAGLPTVADAVGGAIELVGEPDAGVVLPFEASASDFAEALIAISRDPDQRRRYAEGALCTARQYTIDRMMEDILELYRSIAVARSI